ncbi:hypothetical protein ATO10_04547 [Actibacterium atlanticum]|uniref:Uncharacterized protein n=1 Tax=Actibacterium atlanticum TaxID=1461693 RepID=A0A058ZML2_9RHOB|nr:hypothetical protein [Actibacterium atlanticum]KCV82849.1 hypothetical protein ATO10_04547 [Actibacterium atlanticum]
MFDNLTLTPTTGVILVLVMIFAGRAFRENWKAQGPNWVLKAWLYGLPAAAAFAALAFIPLEIG